MDRGAAHERRAGVHLRRPLLCSTAVLAAVGSPVFAGPDDGGGPPLIPGSRQVHIRNASGGIGVHTAAACYAADVVIRRLPSGATVAEGREALRATYGKLFEAAPELHCKLLHRVVHGRCVVDHEDVSGMPGRDRVRAVAIYEVEEGLIRNVWFLEE